MSDQTPQDPYSVPPPGSVPPPPPPPGTPAAPPPAVPAAGGYPPPPPAGYPAPTYPAAGYPGGQPKPGHSGLSITALVIAVVVVFICWIPFIGPLAALVALGLGIAAWITSKKADRPVALGITATVLSILTFLAGIAITIVLVVFIDEVSDEYEYCDSITNNQEDLDRCLEDRIYERLDINPTP
jgi:hypothetical protein